MSSKKRPDAKTVKKAIREEIERQENNLKSENLIENQKMRLNQYNAFLDLIKRLFP